jgi:hypothetical protein
VHPGPVGLVNRACSPSALTCDVSLLSCYYSSDVCFFRNQNVMTDKNVKKRRSSCSPASNWNKGRKCTLCCPQGVHFWKAGCSQACADCEKCIPVLSMPEGRVQLHDWLHYAPWRCCPSEALIPTNAYIHVSHADEPCPDNVKTAWIPSKQSRMSGKLERIASSVLCDNNDPSRLTWRELSSQLLSFQCSQ